MTAAFVLVERVKIASLPAPRRVQATLTYRARLALAVTAVPENPSVGGDLTRFLDIEKRARAAEAATAAEIDAVSSRLSGLSIESNRRRRSLWSRWLPRHDDGGEIVRLRQRLEGLKARADMLAQRRLKAEIDTRNARRRLDRARAEALREHEHTLAKAEKQLATLRRAQRLIANVPSLTYAGSRWLLAVAARIEDVIERGRDAWPTSKPSA